MKANSLVYPPFKTEGKEIGVDVGAGLGNLVVAFDGQSHQRFSNPQPIKRNLKLLRRCSQAVSGSAKRKPAYIGNWKKKDKILAHYNTRWMEHREEKKKGSKSHERKLLRLQRVQKRIANIREANHHLISRQLVTGAKAIGLETLQSIKANESLPKHLQTIKNRNLRDASMHTLISFVEYKSKQEGVETVFARKHYKSSQRCSACGNEEKIDKNGKHAHTYQCAKCGHKQDRDENASINLHPPRVRKDWEEYEKNIERVKPISRRSNGGKRKPKPLKTIPSKEDAAHR